MYKDCVKFQFVLLPYNANDIIPHSLAMGSITCSITFRQHN